MNYILKIVLAHIVAAFLENWKTTLFGCLVAVVGVMPQVLPLLQGKDWSSVNWSSVLGLMASAVGLVLAKDITITKVIEATPKAQPVKK